MPDTREFTLEDIAALAELPRRTVRYYIQLGLMDRPHGIGKGAYYTHQHVEQLLLIKKWSQAGLSLERIGEVMKQPAAGLLPPAPRRSGTVEVWSHLVVDDGVEVALDPGRAGLAPEQVRAFFRAVTRAYQEINPRDPRESVIDSEEHS